MCSDVVVRVQGLGKSYRIFAHPTDRIKQALSLGRRKFHTEFQALRNISFDIQKGEAIGIIGRNGSGKSTLLQLLCGVLKPSAGQIQVQGRVCALLELGSGFNPEFTGRENVYFQGAVTGFSREQVDARMERILAFADIGAFIDQPVRTYSSGMFVRLAFAVIAFSDADIFVIDEALAVGDIFFQQKCMRFLREFKSQGGTILFVSHDTTTVLTLCDRAILMVPPGHESIQIGSAAEICKEYVKRLYHRPDGQATMIASHDRTPDGHLRQTSVMTLQTVARQSATFESMQANYQAGSFRKEAESFGQGGAKIVAAWFENAARNPITTFSAEERISLCLQIESVHGIESPAFGFSIKNYLGQLVISEGTEYAFPQHTLQLRAGQTHQARFSFDMPTLLPGEYAINLALAQLLDHGHMQHHWLEDAIALRCMGGRLVQGSCGVPNLEIEISGVALTTGNLP